MNYFAFTPTVGPTTAARIQELMGSVRTQFDARSSVPSEWLAYPSYGTQPDASGVRQIHTVSERVDPVLIPAFLFRTFNFKPPEPGDPGFLRLSQVIRLEGPELTIAAALTIQPKSLPQIMEPTSVGAIALGIIQGMFG